MAEDNVIRLEPNSTYRLETHTQQPHHPINSACSCLHCMAATRLLALASVFEAAGNDCSADVCTEWATHAAIRNPIGEQIARAIVEGEFCDAQG